MSHLPEPRPDRGDSDDEASADTGVSARIGEGDLEAYLRGEADPRIAAIIERSPHLLSQAEALRHVDAALLRVFYQEGRPSAEELADFVTGVASDAQRLRIAAYLREHPEGQQEIDDLRRTLNPSPGPIELLRERAALALQATTAAIQALGLTEAPAGARGDIRQILYEIDDYAISVQVYPAVRGASYAVSGQAHAGMAGDENARDAEIARESNTLPQDDDLSGQAWLIPAGDDSDFENPDGKPIEAGVPASGMFLFDDVSPGRYDLLLELKPCSLRIADFIV